MSQVILVLTLLWFIALWLCEKCFNCGYVEKEKEEKQLFKKKKKIVGKSKLNQ